MKNVTRLITILAYLLLWSCGDSKGVSEADTTQSEDQGSRVPGRRAADGLGAILRCRAALHRPDGHADAVGRHQPP